MNEITYYLLLNTILNSTPEKLKALSKLILSIAVLVVACRFGF